MRPTPLVSALPAEDLGLLNERFKAGKLYFVNTRSIRIIFPVSDKLAIAFFALKRARFVLPCAATLSILGRWPVTVTFRGLSVGIIMAAKAFPRCRLAVRDHPAREPGPVAFAPNME